MKGLLLFLTVLSSLFASEYKQTFVDAKNHLEWEDTPHVEHEDKWAISKSYCSSLNLGGNNDWRLPTKKELFTLIPHAKANKLHYGVLKGYWTSQEYEKDRVNAWAVYLKSAHPYDYDKCETEHIRCVRDKFQ